MNRIILLFLMVIVTATGHAQKAPGKEETIAWLKEKLEKCLDGTYTFAYRTNNGPWIPDGKLTNLTLESINECEFVIRYTKGDKNFKALFPTDIAGIKDVFKGTDVPVECTTFFYKAKVIRKDDLTENSSEYTSDIGGINIALLEDDIYLRIEKAMKHLATFCPKKKETF